MKTKRFILVALTLVAAACVHKATPFTLGAGAEAAANPEDPFDEPTSKDDGGPTDAATLYADEAEIETYPDSSVPGCDNSVADLSPCAAPSSTTPDTGLPPCLTAAVCSNLQTFLVPLSAGAAMACLSSSAGCVPGDFGNCFTSGASSACQDDDGDAGDPTCAQIAEACQASADVTLIGSACNAIAAGLTAAGKSAYAQCAMANCTLDGFNTCAATIVQ